MGNGSSSYDELIEGIDGRSTEELESLGFEPLSVGFANIVCGKTEGGEELIVKRYTDLAFLRLTPETIGAADVYAGETGAGPRVLHSTTRGLVEERLPGRTLGEADMHKSDFDLLDLVAKAVASYHKLPVPAVLEGEPMLWRTVDKMMEVLVNQPELIPAGMPSLEVMLAEVVEAKKLLERRQPKVVMGHNDLKPSNAILGDGAVKLIDYELGGPSYRGFDLMKLFRTEAPTSEESMQHFFQKYAEEAGGDEKAADLAEEARAFLPLTWLEAGIFFLTLPHFKPDETARWNKLALDRWRKYMETRNLLSPPEEEKVVARRDAGCLQGVSAMTGSCLEPLLAKGAKSPSGTGQPNEAA